MFGSFDLFWLDLFLPQQFGYLNPCESKLNDVKENLGYLIRRIIIHSDLNNFICLMFSSNVWNLRPCQIPLARIIVRYIQSGEPALLAWCASTGYGALHIFLLLNTTATTVWVGTLVLLGGPHNSKFENLHFSKYTQNDFANI